jgi:redox-sensing transcriptional repressor
VRRYRVVLVGAGRVGAALAAYPGFRARGFDVVAVYDADPARAGAQVDGVAVRSAERMETDLAAEGADIAVIATPADVAQGVAYRLVRSGVRALLNFAPVALTVPAGVTVSYVNMALELEALSYALHHAQP